MSNFTVGLVLGTGYFLPAANPPACSVLPHSTVVVAVAILRLNCCALHHVYGIALNGFETAGNYLEAGIGNVFIVLERHILEGKLGGFP